MKVSIIIPAYNVGNYIAGTIKSCLDQTYGNIEIVVVDDGSTDNTPEEIRNAVAGHGNCIVVTQSNAGVNHARRKGIETSSGELITFVDGDDRIEPESVETLVRTLEEKNLDIAQMRIKRVTDTYTYIYSEQGSRTLHGYEFLDNLIGQKVNVSMCTKLYRRKFLENMTVFDGIWLGEDKLANIEVSLMQPTIGYTDFPGYLYYQRQGSAHHRRFKAEYILDYENALKQLFVKYGLPEEKADYYMEYNRLWWYLVYIRRSSNKWIGNTPLAKETHRIYRNTKYDFDFIDSKDRIFLKLDPYLIMRPVLSAVSVYYRLRQSLRRRLGKTQ